uniref:Lipocalin/cytosolic fatty-acid binding domain-containing protein n=1 Tax=Amblyomma maculatum TaxID=34609 RepID=G3MKE6_AMBMU
MDDKEINGSLDTTFLCALRCDIDVTHEVLNTSEPLWLYYQTYDNGVSLESLDPAMDVYHLAQTCIYDQMKSISEESYNFTHSLIIGGEKETLHYMAIFDNDGLNSKGPRTSMKVYNETGSGPLFAMKLGYADEHGGCSVFSVTFYEDDTSQGNVDCEVYVRDNQRHNGPTNECMTYFNSSCSPQKLYKPYDEACELFGSHRVPSQ